MSKTQPRISFALSLMAIFMGSIALFTNYWVAARVCSTADAHSFQCLKNEVDSEWNAGFIEGCAGAVCVSIQRMFSMGGPRLTKLGQYYAVAVIGLIYLPLVMMVIAALLKGVSLYLAPPGGCDVSATVFVWIATYHGFGLVICFSVLAAIKDDFKAVEDKSNTGDEYETMNMASYVGLIATLIGFVSALTSCPVFSKDDNRRENEYTEDTVALTSSIVVN